MSAKRSDALFAIERSLNRLPAAERLAELQRQSEPLVADLEAWLRYQRSRLSIARLCLLSRPQGRLELLLSDYSL